MSQASSLQLEVVEMPAGAPVEIRSRSACSRPIDGAAGVSVRIHLIHRLRFCSVKLSTQLQPYNNNGRKLQRLSPAQQCCVCWSSLRGCGLIHDPPQCPRCRISSSAFPLSSRMNFELALCYHPAHHRQTQYDLPRTTDDDTLASHPSVSTAGLYVLGFQTKPLQEPDRYEHTLVPAECQPPSATFATNPTRKVGTEPGTSHWSAATP